MRTSPPIALTILICGLALAIVDPPGDPIPVTGASHAASAPFDRLMIDLMKRYDIPGAAVAVSRHGQILVSRGYGYADLREKRLVQPTSVFRIASVSKPVTAVAVLSLVDQGRLRLEDRVFDVLRYEAAADPRTANITVRQLLEHSAGWDRDTSFDPMFHFGMSSPDRIIREMLSRQLDFTPGAKHAYSNFGYCVLGRLIERVTGKRYEEYVREQLLEPFNIKSMRIGGRKGNGPDEVHYHGGGAYNLLPDVMDAHGGWTSNAVDLVRFANVSLGRGRTAVLRQETLDQMNARPAPPLWQGTQHWYGLGWMVRPAGKGLNLWHGGAMPGTSSLLVCTHHGYTWAALFNRMPAVRGPFVSELDRGLWEASRTAWPEVPAPGTRPAS